MHKRYQVFVSSTFRDLKEERQAVIGLVQEMDHIPAGMELFSSDDVSSWQVIERVIDNSDYYVLIIGACYGSTTPEGVSYTEKEYDYAHSKGIPVLAFVHGSPESIAIGKAELSSEAREKLAQFRSRIEAQHQRSTWTSAEDLKGKVAVALSKQTTINPRVGWVRGDIASEASELLQRIADLEQQKETLRGECERLEGEMAGFISDALLATQGYAQGSEPYLLKLSFTIGPEESKETKAIVVETTWKEMFETLSPLITGPRTENTIRQRIVSKYAENVLAGCADAKNIRLSQGAYEAIRNQFMALELITIDVQEVSGNRRSMLSSSREVEYWYLTEHGMRTLLKSIAIRVNAEPNPN